MFEENKSTGQECSWRTQLSEAVEEKKAVLVRHGPTVIWATDGQGTKLISIWLVVSIPLKNIKVNWDDYSQY